MERKLTPANLALWAALPMAQTSKVEGRILMILDKTRLRELNRRAFYFAAAIGAVALVTLAVLRPMAKAQTVPKATESQTIGGSLVRLVGITDTEKAGASWWSASGAPLPTPTFDTAQYRGERHVAKPEMRSVSFVFDLPAALQDADVTIKTESGGWAASHSSSQPGQWTFTSGFQPALKTTAIGLGLAAGAWITAVSDSNPTQSTSDSSGGISFLLSPVSALKQESVITITTNGGEIKDDVKFVALDLQGRKYGSSDMSMTADSAAQQRTLRFSLPPSQIKEIRIETRPFIWTEFKDVALQPTQIASTPSLPEETTPWSGQDISSAWGPSKQFHLILHIAPSVSGTRPDPPVSGKLVPGPGQATNFSIKVWKPGKSNFLTVRYDYTPKIADKSHSDVIHLLTKQGAVASVIKLHSI
ncbi:MAG: hypothetical protein ACRYFS_24035 [Janthinobacterium lividum]